MKTNRIPSLSLLAALAGTSFGGPLVAQTAQTQIAPVPSDVAPWSCGNIYYVSIAGSNNNAGTLASPWRTVTHAVSQALSQTSSGNPITINVRAGSYSAGESFPIELPARGIKLQAFEPGVTISGTQFEPVLRVDRAGASNGSCGVTPGTVIRGLTLRDGITGIEIDTSLAGGVANTPDRVHVHRCQLVQNRGNGIAIWTRAGHYSQHVVEECEIAFNANSNGFGTGVNALNLGGTSTNLIRANNIHDNEVGINVFGTPTTTEPRILSNFVRDAEWGIALLDCSARVVNNTQGYGRPFSFNQPVFGVILAGGGNVVLANNIIWNPPGYAVGAAGVTDLSNGSTGVVTQASNWILSTVGAGNPPQFVAPPTDLHLQASSPLLDAGTNSYVLPTINVQVGPLSARADCAVDIDGDSRVLDFAQDTAPDVEIGADERSDGGGAPVRLSCQQLDAFGNLHTNGVPTAVNIDLGGMPGDLAVVFFWIPQSVDPIPYHRFTTLGSWSMPGNNEVRRAGSGVVGTAGTFTVPLVISPALGLELEVFLQGATLNGGTGAGAVSNRLLLEIDE
ncbi:MAG: right-handed parallel beta-helix repeat-containing protein [Planctomycetes bacterium]|nr:right-handed parallel beta-helix repeat-containing protein [Planctomycetota bacterium]